jgi:TIR domain-containing protein
MSVMRKTRIFVSYCWKSDYTQQLCAALEKRLRDTRFDILRDEPCTPEGGLWRPRINGWLCDCHGALVFFSREALKSKWVQYETAILSWRKSLQRDFVVLPVLLDGVSGRAIRRGSFSALEIGEIKPLKQNMESPDDLAARIVAKLSKTPRRPANCEMHEWIEDVAANLCNASSQHLRRAARALGMDDNLVALFDKLPTTLAHQLLHADKKMVVAALHALKRGVDAESLEDIKRLVKPNWVQTQAARRIIRVTKRPPSRRALSINTSRTTTGKAYVCRAHCCSPRLHLICTSGITGTSDHSDILDAYDRALRRVLGLEQEDSPEYVSECLESTVEPVFALVCTRAIRKGVLDALRQKYPSVTFVVLPGEEFPNRTELGLAALELIRPRLTPEAERDGRRFMRQVDMIQKWDIEL